MEEEYILMDEVVLPQPALSTRDIVEFANEVLAELYPDNLIMPTQFDIGHLIEVVCPRHGLNFEPTYEDELQWNEACVIVNGRVGDPVTILVHADIYDGMVKEDFRIRRARSTFLHEFSHLILHLNPTRRLLAQLNNDPIRLNRMVRIRREIPAYRDPEWQAWAMAGALAMPLSMLKEHQHLDREEFVGMFGVSRDFVDSHLNRLQNARLI